MKERARNGRTEKMSDGVGGRGGENGGGHGRARSKKSGWVKAWESQEGKTAGPEGENEVSVGGRGAKNLGG